MLAALQKGGEAVGDWAEARTLQRGAPGLPAAAMQAVFSAPAEPLPAFVGVASSEGDYVIYRVDAVERPQIAGDDERIELVAAQYSQLLAGRDFAGFLADLRQRYKVEISPRALQVQ